MNYQLYNKTVSLDFDEIRHRFWLNDKPVLSVTACTGIIDKPFLVPWAVKMFREFLTEKLDQLIASKSPDEILGLIDEGSRQHTQKRDKAADVGTQTHKWIEGFIKAKLKNQIPDLPTDPQVLNAVKAFLSWVDDHGIKFKSSERIVYSKKYRYAGIMDAEAVIDGKLCVIDFKTSSGIYSVMRYQVAAYQAAAEEENGKPYIGHKWIVRFGKNDGEFEAKQFDDHPKDFKVFLATLAIKRREKELSSWKDK